MTSFSAPIPKNSPLAPSPLTVHPKASNPSPLAPPPATSPSLAAPSIWRSPSPPSRSTTISTLSNPSSPAPAASKKTRDSTAITYDDDYLQRTSTLILGNQTLANLKVTAALLGGGGIMGSGGARPAQPATVFFEENDGTTLTAQLQLFDSPHVKCVKIELKQQGSDIWGKGVYAKYLETSAIGLDFDNPEITKHGVSTTDTEFTYGVKSITLDTITDSSFALRLTGSNTYTGDTTNESGFPLEITGDNGQLGAGNYTSNIASDGDIIFSSDATQILTGNLSGTGRLVKQTDTSDTITDSYGSFLTQSHVLIYPNRSLIDITELTGTMGGAAINNTSTPIPTTVFHIRRTGTTMTYQLQSKAGTLNRCVKVELKQIPEGVTAKALYARYFFDDGEDRFGYDFNIPHPGNTNQGLALVSSYESHGYGVPTSGATFNKGSTLLTLNGANSMSQGIAINGGYVVATARNALSSSAPVNHVNKGFLFLTNDGGSAESTGGFGGETPIHVGAEGVLIPSHNWSTGMKQQIILNSGTLQFNSGSSGDAGTYLNRITLRNGALVTGNTFRTGNRNPVIFKVEGTAPSAMTTGLMLVKQSSVNINTLFDVDDVTGDPDIDFTMSGSMRDYSVDLGSMLVRKAGAGTMALTASMGTTYGNLQIEAGTLLLQANNAIKNDLIMAGGTLALTGDYDNNVAVMQLTANSAITLDGTPTIAFADSSASTWSGTLTITGEMPPKTIRFGTSKTALTTAQQNAITLNGERTMLDSEGYLKLYSPGGTKLLLR